MKPVLTKSVLTKSIVLQLAPSSLLLGLLVLVATASAMIICFSPIILSIKCAVFVLIIASTAYFILRDALLILPWSWQIVEVDVKGELKLINKRQQVFKPQIAATSFTHQYLTILNFKREGFKMVLPPVLLMPQFSNRKDDAKNESVYKQKEALRRLRVWMRFFKHDQIAP